MGWLGESGFRHTVNALLGLELLQLEVYNPPPPPPPPTHTHPNPSHNPFCHVLSLCLSLSLSLLSCQDFFISPRVNRLHEITQRAFQFSFILNPIIPLPILIQPTIYIALVWMSALVPMLWAPTPRWIRLNMYAHIFGVQMLNISWKHLWWPIPGADVMSVQNIRLNTGNISFPSVKWLFAML